ncbi:hypothetical protein P3W45_001567 [Vairimorpha bombi]
MIDINLIRDSETRNTVIESEKKRFKDPNIVLRVFKEHKQSAKEMSKDLVQELKDTEEKGADLENQLNTTADEINKLMKSIGNIIDDRVLVSKNEDENPIIRKYRTSRSIKNIRSYTDLMMKYTHSVPGSKIIGHRGYFLSGKIAKLGMALSRYAIEFLEQNEYMLIQTPVMMRKEVMGRTAQLSDFDEQLYKVEDDLYLIATSEQPLSALHMDERMTDSDLPKKYCGQSLCFRKEAGAHGKDNSGIFRVHQFEKIEQFVICKPEESGDYFDRMIKLSEEFYKSLDISYNVVSIVSGEFNDAAAIKYDLEAFFPNANKFRELVSCSNCTDYQSRELEVRYGILKENNKKIYVHMLNSTLCAVQRTLCCIVENYQEENKIVVPEVLRKYTEFDEIELD